jgi:CDP-glucose 4,6-dehydratase
MGLNKVLKQYKGKKVFITGHTGFKGAWLSYLLDKQGAITRGYALEPYTNPSLYSTLKFSNNHSNVISDINDYKKIKKEIKNFKPDYIFHLAAQPLVIESYNCPKYTFETNFNGTLNLLEVLKSYNLPITAVFITTDKVYENKELNIPFSEEDKLGGEDPYSASKAASEILIHSYTTSFFKHSLVKLASARAGNVIGGGDWSDYRLVPDIIKAEFENEELKIRNPIATRPWQHVLEPLYGYLKLASLLEKNPTKYSGSWNFGPNLNDIKTVGEIIKIAQGLEFNVSISEGDQAFKKESKFLALDISRAKKQLGFIPKWSSEKALRYTLEWYKNFYDGKPVNELMEKDVINYNLPDERV